MSVWPTVAMVSGESVPTLRIPPPHTFGNSLQGGGASGPAAHSLPSLACAKMYYDWGRDPNI